VAENILILTADAGFGHRRAAQAVEAALNELCDGKFEVIVTNPIEDPQVPQFMRQTESGYDDMVTHEPGLYLLSYKATDIPPVAQAIQDIAAMAMHQAIALQIERHRPSVLVSTYPVFTQAVIRSLREIGHSAPVTIVVTDLIDVHALWFHKEANLTFTPTEYVHEQALAYGLSEDRVYLSGLPVHPNIARETRNSVEIREALGWDTRMPTALIVGSARSRQTAIVAKLLDQSGLDLQVVAVSGGVPEIDAELLAAQWKGRVHTYSRVSNLPEMMHAADFIICKAGGLIISESLACGLPLILYEALPGQEAGNVRYVVESGAGVWAPDPVGALAACYAWLGKDKADFEACRIAAGRVGRPRAAYEVAGQVLQYLA
jgi:1,2-diacylglycerol 3-beta-galactosyltransferase